MAEQQDKLKKLFNARSNLESELCNIHKDITDAIDRQDRRVKVERLVWVVEETNPRGYYPTARITELRYGSDSFARSAVLRTSSGSLVRPLVKLVPILPASSGPEDVSN